MNKNARHTRVPGAWVLGGVASLLMAVSAFGQYSPTGPGLTVNDLNKADPFPSTIRTTNASLAGTVTKATVTLRNVKHTYAPDLSVMLVGPNNNKVMLINQAGNVGAASELNGITFTFEHGKDAIPQNGAITDGAIYGPGSYAADPFAGDNIAGTFGTLALFNGIDPKANGGEWKLYVRDTKSDDVGTIGEWALNLWLTPSVQGETTNRVALVENTGGSWNFKVSSSSTPLNNLTVWAESQVPNLVATSNLVVTAQPNASGIGTLTIVRPIPDTFGTNDSAIKVFVRDGTLVTNEFVLALNVAYANQTPKITNLRTIDGVATNSATVIAGTMSAPQLLVDVSDVHIGFGGTLNTILVTGLSDNAAVPNSGIFVTTPADTSKRIITVVPDAAVKTPTLAHVDIWASDGILSNKVTLNVNVVKPAQQELFSKTTAITADAGGNVTSTINVSGVVGQSGKIAVNLVGVQDYTPRMTVQLTPPAAGATPITLDAIGPDAALDYGLITFNTAGGNSFGTADNLTNGLSILASGLADLAGFAPNGEWKLTISGATPNATKIAGGWAIGFVPGPSLPGIADLFIQENTSGERSVNATTLVGLTSVSTTWSNNVALGTVTATTTGTNVVVKVAGASQVYGTNHLHVTVTDRNGFTSMSTFLVGISRVNDAPTISSILKQDSRLGRPILDTPFTVTDADNSFDQLTVTAESDNQKLLPNSNIYIKVVSVTGENVGTTGTNTSANLTISMFPIQGATVPTANVTIRVKQAGAEATRSFPVFVPEAQYNLVVNPAPITINSTTVNEGKADPYPSIITVPKLKGKIEQVEVSLFNVSYSNTVPQDLSALLVGPGNNKVLLFGKIEAPFNNTTLIFTTNAADNLHSPPATGVYLAGGGALIEFPSNPGATLYTGDLNVFAGLDPSTNWSLYVYTTNGTKGGVISGGWQLSIRTAPASPIEGLPPVIYTEEMVTSKPVTIVLGDEQPGNPFTITSDFQSSNPAIPFSAPNGLIEEVILNKLTSASYSLSVKPKAYAWGTNAGTQITLSVKEGGVTKVTTNIGFAVAFVPQPPVIMAPESVSAFAAAFAPETFTVRVYDPQGSNTTLTVTSTRETIVPNGNISVVPASSNSPDRTNVFTVSWLPVGVANGELAFNLSAQDNVGQKATGSVKVTVNRVFAAENRTAITIPEGLPVAGTATPYPSIATIENLEGVVSDVEVTLNGFSHRFPQDVSILLVSPKDDRAVMLMSHAGGANNVSSKRIRFSKSGAELPSAGALDSAIYKPADYSNGRVLPSPAPAPAPGQRYSTDLTSFNGIEPNGAWKLYVLDDTFPDAGSISEGWLLTIKTGPAIENPGPQSVVENGTLEVPLRVRDSATGITNLLIYTVFGGNDPANLFTNAATQLAISNNPAALFLTIKPTKDMPSADAGILNTKKDGTNLVTLLAVDLAQLFTNSVQFPVRVTYDNQDTLVTYATVTNRVDMAENTGSGSTNLTWTFTDVDSPIWGTNITVTSGNPALVTNIVRVGAANLSDVAAKGTNTTTWTITPIPFAYGLAPITVSVFDGYNTVTHTVNLEVANIWQPPTVRTSGTNTHWEVIAGGTTTVPLTVTTLEPTVNVKNVLVSGISSDESVVPNRNIVVLPGADGNTREMQIAAIGTVEKTVTITLVASDGTATNNPAGSFVLNVTKPLDTRWGNTNTIVFNGGSATAPYPSEITVSNMFGAVYNVSLLLDGLNAANPANLNVLLVQESLDGNTNAVLVMSGAGGSTLVENARLTLDDGAANSIPQSSLASGTYKPTSYNSLKTVVLPGPAPTNGIWKAELNAFKGRNPNGVWKLFVQNVGSGQARLLAGWQLEITPAPEIRFVTGTPSPLEVAVNSSTPVQFTVRDMKQSDKNQFVLSKFSSNLGVLPDRGVILPSDLVLGTSSANTVTVEPAEFQSGESTMRLTISNKVSGAIASAELLVKVGVSNTPPTISRIDPVTMVENSSRVVSFVVQDPDSKLSSLSLRATSEDTNIIANTGLRFPNGNNVLVGLPENAAPQFSLIDLTVTPNAFKATNSPGIKIFLELIDVTGTGSNYLATNFVVVVNQTNLAPIITDLPIEASVASGRSVRIGPFKVFDINQKGYTVAVTGKSSDQNLVKDVNIVTVPAGLSGETNRFLDITAESTVAAGGPVRIDVTAANNGPGASAATASFKLNVRPARVVSFANAKGITIRDNQTAADYPSSVGVSGLMGPIDKVTVKLNGFTHTYPSDVGVLLVSPTGKNIVLMNKAGGGGGAQIVNNLTLTFDDTLAASEEIPAAAALTSKAYKPRDYKKDSNPNYDFPATAPVHPYTNTLTQLVGTDPNGTWSLFVVDDTSGDSGAISNGWTLSITTKPVISGLTDLVTDKNVSTSQAFTIADDAAEPGYTASSFQTVIVEGTSVKADGVSYAGKGTNWTVVINPAANLDGKTKLKVRATNADGQTVDSNEFTVTVNPVNTDPSIATPADVTIVAGTVAVVPLSFSDSETSKDKLKLSFVSSNETLAPVSTFKMVNITNLVIAPIGAEYGDANITVTVTDEGGKTASTKFNLHVLPNTGLFASTGGITIRDNASAQPYPSALTVNGLGGTITKVTATLVGFKHTFPSDVSILLVGPRGQNVVLMSNAGGGVPVDNIRLNFDDASTLAVPQFTKIEDGTYKPSDYTVTDSYKQEGTPRPPAPPYGNLMSVFNDTNPNGTWYLYVQDNASPDSGAILGGWNLTFVTTGPSVSPVAAQTTPENTTLSVPFTVNSAGVAASNLIVTATVSDETPAGLVGKLIVNGTDSARSLEIRPAQDMPSKVSTANGTANITLTVTDGTLTNSTSFPLTVTYVNQAPVISDLSDVSTQGGVPVTTTFSVTDVDSASTNLTVSYSLSRETGTVVLTGDTSDLKLTFTPFATIEALGETVITVTATDGISTTTDSYTVTVTAVPAPVISEIPPQEMLANGTLIVSFTVTHFTPNLQVVGVSDNEALVREVIIGGGPNNYTATVSLVPNATGAATVTLYARDEWGIGTGQFALSVISGNVRPTISPITAQTTLANEPVTVNFTVTDPDSTTLTVSASADKGTVVLTGTPDAQKLTYTPVNSVDGLGDATVTITATDGDETATSTFKVTVNAPAAPAISEIANVTVEENKVATAQFVVTHSTTNLIVSGASANTNLVASVVVAGSGTNYSAQITLVPGANSEDFGTAEITITARDEWGIAQQVFTVTVEAVDTATPATLTVKKAGNQLTLGFAGSPNTSYRVEGTSNFTTWTEVGVVTTDANGAATLTIDLANAPGSQYYRAVSQ